MNKEDKLWLISGLRYCRITVHFTGWNKQKSYQKKAPEEYLSFTDGLGLDRIRSYDTYIINTISIFYYLNSRAEQMELEGISTL